MISKVMSNFDKRLRGWTDVEVEVAFTQSYAIWVHEIQARHPVGQWKFLETAAVQNRDEAVRIFAKTFVETGDAEKSMLKTGLFIQAEAQKLTPVDTGALKSSATTSLV